jgi:LPXTG-motif cell wall-anchored protein
MIRRFRSSRVLVVAVAVGATCTVVGGSPAAAQQAPVGLGTAASFAVLAGTTVTNTGPSVISGDVGVSPGTAVVGFPPGIVNNGTIHAADAVAAQAQADLTTAYNDAAGRSTTATVTADLAGQTLVSGVYTGATLGLTGTVTLDAQGDPNAVFIFQAASTLITASSSVVALTNGADACNVYWQVGSSATLGTNSTFVGTVLALTSITATTSATINGRLLARNGAVTLDSNTITACGTSTTPTTTTTTTQAPTTTTQAPTATTQAPTATTVAAVPSTTVAGGLPRTGRSTVPLLVLASGLVLVGGVFMAARRRNHA